VHRHAVVGLVDGRQQPHHPRCLLAWLAG
jgi:hypothetical protein